MEARSAENIAIIGSVLQDLHIPGTKSRTPLYFRFLPKNNKYFTKK